MNIVNALYPYSNIEELGGNIPQTIVKQYNRYGKGFIGIEFSYINSVVVENLVPETIVTLTETL